MQLRYSSIFRFLLILFITVISFTIIDNNPIGFIVLISIITDLIFCVIIGDGFLLPKFGNSVTSLVEATLAFLLVVVIDRMSINFNTRLVVNLLFWLLLILFEYVFHRYLFSKERIQI